MIGLTVLALASVLGQPFDNETWSLLASKLIVPFALVSSGGTGVHRGTTVPAV